MYQFFILASVLVSPILYAKPFRLASLYAATSLGHYNCTCHEEALCITKAVIKRAKSEGLDIETENLAQDRGILNTLSAAQTAVQDKYDAVVGTFVTPDALIASDVFEKAHVPFIVPTATHPKITEGRKYITRLTFNDYRQASLLARLTAKELKPRSVAIIRNVSQPYCDFITKEYEKDLRKRNPNVKIRVFPILNDFREFKGLTKTILSEKTDLIFAPLSQANLASLFVELENHKVRLVLLGSDTIEGTPEFFTQLGPKTGHIRFIYPKHWNDRLEGPEAQRYKALHKSNCSRYKSTMTSVVAYDAAELLVQTLKKEPTARGQRLISLIRSQKFHGLLGKFGYDTHGDPVKPLELFQLSHNTVRYWKRYQ